MGSRSSRSSSLQIWHRNKQFSILLLISVSIFFILVTSIAEGRGIPSPLTKGESVGSAEEKVGTMRNQMGSRPPSCRRRCRECGGHCEAVQVPVALLDSSHQNQRKKRSTHNFSATQHHHDHNVVTSSEDETSNYKPISWKCKCGNFIFNP